MPAFAPAALATAVALSALGAVALCVLVVLYGFNAEDESSLERATRRLFLTRIGHALAAACFTATAILIATVLVQRAPAPAVAPAADSRVPVLGERVAGQEKRLSETETRIRELQDALRQREAVPAQAVPERAVPAPPIQRPAVTKPSPAAPVRPAPRTSVRPIEEIAASGASAPAASSQPPPPIAAVPPSARPPEAALAPSASRSTPRRTLDVPSKLREDWREIQRGVDSAGDDFRSAVQGLRQRFLGE